jgi:hypothetical protein
MCTLILPVLLDRREAIDITFMGERRLRVFENRVLRRNNGPKRD